MPFAAAVVQKHVTMIQIWHFRVCKIREIFVLATTIGLSTSTGESPHASSNISHFGACAVSRARSEALVLAPLNSMRGHGTFEPCLQNACKYASKCAMQKVGVLIR